MALDNEVLNTERSRLRDVLREIEADQRKLEAKLKGLRQDELKVKREIEALSTLLELTDAKQDKAGDAASSA